MRLSFIFFSFFIFFYYSSQLNAHLKSCTIYKKQHLCFTPQHFGAAADGVTDDTKAIQRAIDSINCRGGGMLLFPRGVYLIKDFSVRYDIGHGAIDLKSNVFLKGENGAVIKVADSVNTRKIRWQGVFISRYEEFSTNVTFENLIFDLNGANNLYPYYKDFKNNSCCAAIRTCYPKNITVKGCVVQNCPGLNCFALGYADKAVVSDCSFFNSADAIKNNKVHDHSCILISGNDVCITNNKAINARHSYVGTGIEVNSIGAIVSYNYVTGFKVGCLLSPVGITSLRDIEVIENKFENNQIAFQVWDGNSGTESSNIRFINNLILCPDSMFYGNYAIDLITKVRREVKNVVLEGNIIKQNISKPTRYFYEGLVAGKHVTGLIIRNNKFIGLSGTAISLLRGSKKVSISGNLLVDCCNSTNKEANRIILVNSGSDDVSEGLIIEKNTIITKHKSGLRGIWLINNFSDLTICNNEFKGFEQYNEVDKALVHSINNSEVIN